MAAIGRFQKDGEIFYARVADGELFRLRGDVFGSPSFDRKPMPRKGVKTLVPVMPSKIIAVGLNYLEHARETGKPLPRTPLFWLKATTSLLRDGGKIETHFLMAPRRRSTNPPAFLRSTQRRTVTRSLSGSIQTMWLPQPKAK